MKISLQKESTGMYFAKIIGEEWIHAVADTPQESIEILLDIYKEVNEIRYQKFYKKLFGDNKQHNIFIGMLNFRSLTLSA
jgi:hypothetical protein